MGHCIMRRLCGLVSNPIEYIFSVNKFVEKENQVQRGLPYTLHYPWNKHNPNKSHDVGIQAGEAGDLLAPLLSFVVILVLHHLCLK